jgi:hypothetical protein
MNQPPIYRLRRPDLPWGDYGDILAHGMASRSKDGDLELERTGPFVPPFSQPSDFVVVTAGFLREIQGSGLTGYLFGPVKKKRISKVEWREWEPYGPKEMRYPAGGEPENYVLRRKHSPETAEAIGELWEIRFQPAIRVSRDGGYHLVLSSWDGSDFIVAQGEHPIYNYVSEKAREWLQEKVPEWIAFEQERVK